MKTVKQEYLSGERALFNSKDLEVIDCIFDDGESPLKESSNLKITNSIFKWKYPLWYCHNVEATNISLLNTARSGIWYTKNITIKDSIIEAPKTFRRAEKIVLENVELPNASETFWNCNDINLKNVTAKGDYFGFNSSNIQINNFSLSGNYAFDGGKNIEVRNAKMLSKDSFWNCENVTVYDSLIIGEYLGWNSQNITFVNCTIESLQGMCYMKNVKLINCKLLNTTLAFEYSTVEAEIKSTIDSVKNPISGQIEAYGIKDLIMDEKVITPSKTKIKVGKK